MTTDDQPQMALTELQRNVSEALADKDVRLGRMYIGALAVLEQAFNPDRVPQSAHSFRELMEKLPRYMDLPVPKDPPSMTYRVRQLEESWDQLPNDPDAADAGSRDAIQRYLRASKEFFAQVDEINPKRRDRLERIFQSLDPIGIPLPQAIEDNRTAVWEDAWTFFTDTAHHRGEPVGVDAIRSKARGLERLLLDQLRPRTFEDQDEIDLIIQEGESDA